MQQSAAMEDRGLDDLIDFARLSEWMDAEGLGAGAIEGGERIGGGTQNLLVRFRRGDEHYVLRRPPAHGLSDGNRVMMREARVLGALAGSNVPHPRLVAACADADVLGRSFYLMRPIDGVNLTLGLPASWQDAGRQQAIGMAMVGGIAALAAVDPFAAGLGDFGRLEGYLDRQAERWRAQLGGYARYDGWPGAAALSGVDRVGRWIADHLPRAIVPGIVHGDYHLANVMFQHETPALAAIVDWELATLGDPLLDLGWLVATWPDRAGGSTGSGVAVPGASDLAPASDLVAFYGASSGRAMSDFPWFAVLACYKLAILQEGTFARACAGKAPRDIGAWSHDRAVEMMGRATRFMAAAEAGEGPFA